MGKGADPNCGTAVQAPSTKRRGQSRQMRSRFSGFATPEDMINFARGALERTGVKEDDFFLLDLRGSGLESQEARNAFQAVAYEMGIDLHIFDHEDSLSNEELGRRAYLMKLASKGAGTYLSLGSHKSREADPDLHEDLRNHQLAVDDIDNASVNIEKALERDRLIGEFERSLIKGKTERTLRSSGIVWPTEVWASRVYPGLSPEDAQARLANCLARATFADDPDARAEHLAVLKERAQELNDFAVDEVEVVTPPDREGPFRDHPYNRGTNLSIGMAEGQSFITCDTENIYGERQALNNPSDEVFGTPSTKRVSGHLTTTRPAIINDPQEGEVVIDGIYMEFEEGKITRLVALNPKQQELVERIFSAERMTDTISEVGIAGSDGALAQEMHNGKPVNFYNTMCDENAGFHIAFGGSYLSFTGGTPLSQGGDAAEAMHTQKTSEGYLQGHHDIVIGGPQTSVRVRNRAGEEKDIIKRGSWLDGKTVLGKERHRTSSVKEDQGRSRENRAKSSRKDSRGSSDRESQIKELKILHAENPSITNSEIAQALSIEINSVSSLRKEAKTPGRRGRPKGSRNKKGGAKRMSERDRIEQIKKAYSENPDATNAELAEKMGLGAGSIPRLRKAAGLPQGKRGRRKKDTKE